MKKIFVMAVGLMCLSTVLAAKGGGKPEGETLDVYCTDATPQVESCTVTAHNLMVGKAYQLEVLTNCADSTTVSVTADTSTEVIPVTLAEMDTPGFCETNMFFFYLFTESSKKTQLKLVYTTEFADTD